jgi:hypothetical protein
VIDPLGFLALAFGTVALDIPQGEGYRQFATELCGLPVHRDASQDWDDSILFLTFGGVEKHFEGVSHNSIF